MENHGYVLPSTVDKGNLLPPKTVGRHLQWFKRRLDSLASNKKRSQRQGEMETGKSNTENQGVEWQNSNES